MQKNSSGITLISLVVTVVVVTIITSISGIAVGDLLKNTKYDVAISEMKLLQSYVNEVYEDYVNGRTTIINVDESDSRNSRAALYSTAYNTAVQNNITAKDIGNLSDYKYFTADEIMNIMDIEGIKNDYLINVKSRTIIIPNGIKKDGTTYYSLNEIENEQHNIEYDNPIINISPNGGTYRVNSNENITLASTLTLMNKPDFYDNKFNLELLYGWSSSSTNEPQVWETLLNENGTNVAHTVSNFADNEVMNYYLWTKIIKKDKTTNIGQETIINVSKPYKIIIR